MSSENVTPIADSPASSDFKEEFSSDHPTANRLLAKRSSLAQMLDIGATLLRELHTPGHANWDRHNRNSQKNSPRKLSP